MHLPDFGSNLFVSVIIIDNAGTGAGSVLSVTEDFSPMEEVGLLGQAEVLDDRTECPIKVNSDISSSFGTGLITMFG